MEKLKIKFSTEVVKFEIEAEKIESGDKDFLEKIVGMFNNKVSVCCSPTEQYITKELPTESQLADPNEDSETKIKVETEIVQTDSTEETENSSEAAEEEEKKHNVFEEEQSANTTGNSFPPSVDLLGVKVRQDKSYGYQTYYICPMCKKKGKRFAGQHDKFVYCHDCNFRMNKMDASTGFPEKDSYGNYFVAGDFIPVGLEFKS